MKSERTKRKWLATVLSASRQQKDGTILYLLVVPQTLKKHAIVLAHEKESGHLGQLKTMLKAEEYFYWPNQRTDIKKFVKECITCQQCKTAPALQKRYQELPPVDQPLERVSIDITEMTPAKGGYKYVLTIIDHFSRFVKLVKLRSRHADDIVRAIKSYLGDYGVPRVLLADNACEFRSQVLTELCRTHGIEMAFSTPYHPCGNSITERLHRTLKSVLASLGKGQPHRWSECLTQCQQILNAAVHETTGEQPYFLFFRRHAPRYVGTTLPQVDDEIDINTALEAVRQASRVNSRKWLARANIGRKDQKVEINDLVWIKRELFGSSAERKLGLKWMGPYKVKEVHLDGVSYIVENVFNGKTLHRAADKVRKYIAKDGYVLDVEEVVVPSDEEDEEEGREEPRPTRERRPVRRFIEEL